MIDTIIDPATVTAAGLLDMDPATFAGLVSDNLYAAAPQPLWDALTDRNVMDLTWLTLTKALARVDQQRTSSTGTTVYRRLLENRIQYVEMVATRDLPEGMRLGHPGRELAHNMRVIAELAEAIATHRDQCQPGATAAELDEADDALWELLETTTVATRDGDVLLDDWLAELGQRQQSLSVAA